MVLLAGLFTCDVSIDRQYAAGLARTAMVSSSCEATLVSKSLEEGCIGGARCR